MSTAGNASQDLLQAWLHGENMIPDIVSGSFSSLGVAAPAPLLSTSMMTEPDLSDFGPREFCPFDNCQHQSGFASRAGLCKHISVHHTNSKERLTCTIEGCKRKFDKMADLRQHYRTRHEDEVKAFNCIMPDCDLRFITKRSLNQHMNRKHPGVMLDRNDPESNSNAGPSHLLPSGSGTQQSSHIDEVSQGLSFLSAWSNTYHSNTTRLGSQRALLPPSRSGSLGPEATTGSLHNQSYPLAQLSSYRRAREESNSPGYDHGQVKKAKTNTDVQKKR